jgi:ABC-type methionine transport system ATPase subunit
MYMTTVDINISAGQETVCQPWTWRLCREFNVKVNIIKASVDTDYGWLQLRLEGPLEEIQRATAWLMTTGMNVEAQQRAVGA